MALGNVGQQGQCVLLTHEQDLVLGSCLSPFPPSAPLLPSSVLSACVTHTDGNNFFQLLEEVGEACSLHCWVFLSLALPFLLFWLQNLSS